MGRTIVKIIGLVIIAASFVFILKSPDKSMMDRLLERKKASRPQGSETAEASGGEAEASSDPEAPQK